MTGPKEFWWKDITGPQAFIRQTADALREGFSPVLELPVEIPWRHCMRSAFADRLRELSLGDMPYFETIDAADECGGRDIGDFLLHKYAARNVASAYRARTGATVQQYMRNNGVLKGRLLWIKGIPQADMARWCDFCRGFASTSLEDGCFVLECIGKAPAVADPLKVLRLKDTVSRYDVQLFSAFQIASQESSVPKIWQDYAAAAASRLCGLDAELCEDLLQKEGWNAKDPLALFREASESLSRGTGGPSPEELTQRLWEAQIEVLFPRIESLRIRIVDKLRGELARALRYHPQHQFGQLVTQPEGLEIGTIAYMMTHRDRDNGYEPLISVPDERTYSLISTLWTCRNHLAHRKCCSPQQVGLILTANV